MHVCTASIILLLSITAMAASAEDVTGLVNHNLILPCNYVVDKYPNNICWGRGTCPWSKCNDMIISTNHASVTSRKSDRYELQGNLSQGDVSLTIIKAAKEDEGMYCCRVEVEGLFNDLKKEFKVKIENEDPATVKTPDHHPTRGEENMFTMLEECPDDTD
ncbi:hepatitis A virus cellular receptor 1 homolog [Eleutherodactylus coqui]|uniref:hepatitis A virus cellular receptor 1 homolog n=1 Tax=Eleutherodactylus coqui TaxID=57060 RepID=UPI003462BF7E